MSELRAALERAGYSKVTTVLGSGNIVFDGPKSSRAAMEKKVEAAVEKGVGKAFLVMVRALDELQALIASDPFKGVPLRPDSKRIVTFVRTPPKGLELPIEQDEARIVRLEGHDLFTVYAPTPKGPVFMKLIEGAVGKEQTTRTWDTVQKVAKA
jgi:uncharacterized protein (DUF1697 family)